MEYEYEGSIYNIKKEPFGKQIFFCVMQNPLTEIYDARVLYGGSVEIVQRKIQKQYIKFEKEKQNYE